MANLTIRNLDERVKHELRKLAAEHGVSMEQEARRVLTQGVLNRSRSRRKPTVEELSAWSVKPTRPVDLKQLSDAMWDEGLM